MCEYAGVALFGSGPCRIHVGGVQQRRVEHAQPGVDGEAVTALGRGSRRLEQEGTLRADDAASLDEQLARVEAMVDGRLAELVDDLGRRWLGVMMVAFEPGEVRREGPRLAVDYRVRYVQVGG